MRNKRLIERINRRARLKRAWRERTATARRAIRFASTTAVASFRVACATCSLALEWAEYQKRMDQWRSKK